MSTPIEIVRAHIDALTGNRSHGFARVTAALASVLADERYSQDILRDHIRAVAQEMRAESIAMHVNTHDPFVEPGTREAEITAAKLLAVFADRLEGRES